jgi:hypothetical protein
VCEYDAYPSEYGTDDPVEMAAIDAKTNGLLSLFDGDFDEMLVTVEPVLEYEKRLAEEPLGVIARAELEEARRDPKVLALHDEADQYLALHDEAVG